MARQVEIEIGSNRVFRDSRFDAEYQDENGEPVYYDEEQMPAARARVDELVEKYCD